MTVEVRRATIEDVPACARIVDDWLDATPWMPRDTTYAELEAMLTDGMAIREIYVAGEPVMGYLAFNPVETKVTGLYCAVRDHGVGKALLDRVKEGRSYVQLNTHVPNMRAQRFYMREGFVKCEEVDARDGVRELRMEWRA